ncbi:MAG: SURF1 family protein [Pseudomonadota bacterium]
MRIAGIEGGKRLRITLAALVLIALFAYLGTWQLHRLAWKLALIERVERQLAQRPVEAPGRSRWMHVDRRFEYLPVTATGRFEHRAETFVQAMTVKGSGYWVLTPLVTESGHAVLVNRGFVDPARKDVATRSTGQPHGTVTVVGLLRLSEPAGRLWQSNNAAEGRWYSRDVAAIGRFQNLDDAVLAPYFIDANDTPNPGGWPVGGLTTVRFRNTHLVYALTWYALAGMTGIYAWIAMRKR